MGEIRFPWDILACGFPGGSVVKKPPATVGDMCSNPGSGRSPREGNGNALKYSCPGNAVDRGDWWARPWGCKRVGHDLVTEQQQNKTCIAHWSIRSQKWSQL